MVIVDELPLKFVEASSFKDFVHAACPHFKMPSRRTITRDCYDMYICERLKLNIFLKSHYQRISITTYS